LINTGPFNLKPCVADKIGFDWVCFEQFVVRCSLLLVIVITKVATIFGFVEIGFVLHNLLFLIDPPSPRLRRTGSGTKKN